ncbi:MAG: 16S rRNA processing protein RimM [Deltaproteobacteria bacterium]|nr:16S rRNA processing protein RimM [Deltaproteobacteria bacterium]
MNTHGIRGELRMLPHNPESVALRPGQSLTLRWSDRAIEVRLRTTRPHKRFRLLQFDGYDSATAAAALVGAEVCLAAEQLPRLGPNEIYHRNLIGLQVETVAGQALGRVEAVIATGSNDVCVVHGAGGEHLIPLIADVVREVDLAGGRLVIDPIPGLLD